MSADTLAHRLKHHRRYTSQEVQWRRYLSQRMEVGVAAGAMFLAGLSWGWVLALSYIHHWAAGPLLTWMTLPVLMGIGAMAWAGAVHWSTGWDDVWGARLTEARLGLSPAGQALLEAWCRDGRAVLVRDIQTLERAERLALQARST